MALFLHKRCGYIAGGGNNRVARDLDGGAVLRRADDGAVFDLAERRFQIDRNLLPRKPLTQIRTVCKTDALLGHQIVLHFDNRNVLALQCEFICYLAAGQTAAHDGDFFTHWRAEQILAGFEHLLMAGNLFKHARGRAGGDDHGIGAKGFDLLDLRIQPDLNAKLFHLAAVPCQKVTELALIAFGRGRNERAAKHTGLFIDNRLMAAQRQHAGSLHAADAAADDMNSLRLIRLFDIVLVPLHHLRVDRAARQMQRVAQILIVRHALIVAHVEAAIVAENARADIGLAVFEHLGKPFRVSQEVASKARAVKFSCSDGLGCGIQRHAPRADDGDIDEVFDMLDLGQIAVFRHIHRRMRPVPRVIGSVVAVEHVIARILQEFRGNLGLGHVAACFDVVLAGQRALPEALGLRDDGIAQRHREIRAAGGLDGLDDLSGEAVAVFQTAAVLIRALVDVVERELVEQIALMDSVNLHAVNARVLEQFGALGERVNELLNFLLRHLA